MLYLIKATVKSLILKLNVSQKNFTAALIKLKTWKAFWFI